LVNGPQSKFDGELDAEVWGAMNDAVAAIRAVEDSLGANHHIVAVKGTGGWSRYSTYYIDHTISAGDGENVSIGAGCGVDMDLEPIAWGALLIERFTEPW